MNEDTHKCAYEFIGHQITMMTTNIKAKLNKVDSETKEH